MRGGDGHGIRFGTERSNGRVFKNLDPGVEAGAKQFVDQLSRMHQRGLAGFIQRRQKRGRVDAGLNLSLVEKNGAIAVGLILQICGLVFLGGKRK